MNTKQESDKGEEIMDNQTLTSKQQFMLNQVKATMAIENMTVDEETEQNLKDILTGKKTIEQSIEETKKKYVQT